MYIYVSCRNICSTNKKNMYSMRSVAKTNAKDESNLAKQARKTVKTRNKQTGKTRQNYCVVILSLDEAN